MDADKICGSCEVMCGEDILGDLDDWFLASSDRFYFMEAYDSSSKIFTDPPTSARGGGGRGKGKGKGKSKVKMLALPTEQKNMEDKKPAEFKPLRSLDVFAGCGGKGRACV